MVGFRVFDVGLLVVWPTGSSGCATTATTPTATTAAGARPRAAAARTPGRERHRLAPGRWGLGHGRDRSHGGPSGPPRRRGAEPPLRQPPPSRVRRPRSPLPTHRRGRGAALAQQHRGGADGGWGAPSDGARGHPQCLRVGLPGPHRAGLPLSCFFLACLAARQATRTPPGCRCRSPRSAPPGCRGGGVSSRRVGGRLGLRSRRGAPVGLRRRRLGRGRLRRRGRRPLVGLRDRELGRLGRRPADDSSSPPQPARARGQDEQRAARRARGQRRRPAAAGRSGGSR